MSQKLKDKALAWKNFYLHVSKTGVKTALKCYMVRF